MNEPQAIASPANELDQHFETARDDYWMFC